MPPRTTPRLAYCEYVSPESKGSTAVWTARLYLMLTVRRVYPKMLERLSADVFPAFAELATSESDFDAFVWDPRLSANTHIPEASRLKSALAHWAAEFHVETGWFLDETLRTLSGWFVAPDWRASLKWNQRGRITSTVAIGDNFSFQCEGWEMQLLTWAAYSQSVRERFEQRLAEYENASRKLAESRGLVRAPQKYSPTNFEWFVLYQFAGLSSGEIADRSTKSDSVDISTVLKGIKAAAKLIAWDHLRTPPRKQNRKIR